MTDPLSALLAAIPSLAKAGADIANASDEAKRNAQLIEFQQAIIGLQTNIGLIQGENAALVKRNRELENQLAELQAWGTEKNRYFLVAPWRGSVVYALRESESNSEIPHLICTNCYQNGKKSILNMKQSRERLTYFGCPVCKAEVQTEFNGTVKVKYAEAYPEPEG